MSKQTTPAELAETMASKVIANKSIFSEQKSLYVEQHGDDQLPPLVLIHGWAMHSGVWASWLSYLEPHFSVICVDLPGLGKSASVYPPEYTVDAVATMVLDAVSPLLKGPALWLGWSLGGIVAMKVAELIPPVNPQRAKGKGEDGGRERAQRKEQRLAGIVTLATNPSFVQRENYSTAMDELTFALFQNNLEKDCQQTLNRFAMLMAQGDAKPRELVKQIKGLLFLYKTDPPTRLKESLALLKFDYRPLFSECEVPRLHAFADNDGLVPAAASKDTSILDTSLSIDHSSHLTFISQPQQTLSVLLEFYRNVRA